MHLWTHSAAITCYYIVKRKLLFVNNKEIKTRVCINNKSMSLVIYVICQEDWHCNTHILLVSEQDMFQTMKYYKRVLVIIYDNSAI